MKARVTVAIFSVLLLCVTCKAPGDWKPKARVLVQPEAAFFSPGDVKLLNGPFLESQNAEAKYLLSLDLDRLLSPFLTESGITPKAPAYPGWETRSLPGVALSFYLSGASRLYKLTGNEVYLKNLKYLLSNLGECQKRNDGYLLGSRGGKQVFKKLEDEGYYEGFSNWGEGRGEPYYVMEKLFSGLIDAYRIGYIPEALTIATGLANWLEKHMSHISDSDLQLIMNEEYGGMNWVLADMYIITGDKKFLEMSKRWQDDHVTIPISKGIDILTGIHANTQFPKMSGLAARYPYTADSADLKGASFFWERVVKHRTYATGGNSESEYFWPSDSLSKTLTPFTEENCNVYNMLKLTSLLYKIKPKAEYADFMERALFNHILSAQNTADGRVCYHLPLMPGAERFYRPLFDEFSCCICSGLDSYTRHSEYIYAHTETDLFVNLFIASELTWKEKGIAVKQETQFPYSELSTLKIKCSNQTEMGLNIRNPSWLSGPMIIKINGTVQRLTPVEGYCRINRKWNDNDVVEILLPVNIRYESMPDSKNTIAFFYGPVLLAGELSKAFATDLVLSNLPPALIPGEKTQDQWLQSSSSPLEYNTTIAAPVQIHLKPLFLLKSGPYSVYWKVETSAEYKHGIAEIAKKDDFIRKLEGKISDRVIVGDEVSEHKHSMSGNSTLGKGNMGILEEEAWRSVEPGGFSYTLKTPGDMPVTLLCKFMGRIQYESWDCRIKIDTTTIASMIRGKDETYPVIPYAYCFPVPFELTKGRKTVRVSFEVNATKQMPRLMETGILMKQDYPMYPTIAY